jgi:hypothetical protein
MKSTLLTFPLALPLLLGACGSPEPKGQVSSAILGQQAPDVRLQWLDGSEASSLAELRGRVVLLEFWRTW